MALLRYAKNSFWLQFGIPIEYISQVYFVKATIVIEFAIPENADESTLKTTDKLVAQTYSLSTQETESGG